MAEENIKFFKRGGLENYNNRERHETQGRSLMITYYPHPT